MKVNAGCVCLSLVFCRSAVLYKPLEMVAHTALSGFIAEESFNDPVLDNTAHARHLPFGITQKHMACRCADDGKHFAR